jgi:hypothetical protein
MALRKTHSVNFHGKKIDFEDCYFKVVQITVSKNKASASVHAISDGNTIDQTEYKFTPTLNGENFIAQAYECLKTLPEFSGAIDC